MSQMDVEATGAGANGPSPLNEIEQGVAFFQGRIVPVAEAQVSVATHALHYGTGCFEGIRAYWSARNEQLYVLKMADHYRRFLASCRMIRIDCPYTVEDLERHTLALLRQGGFRQDVYLRPIAFKASKVIKVALSGLRDEVAILAVPMGDYADVRGVRAMVSAWQRISDNAIPARSKLTGSYINIALAVDDAKHKGFDEAILVGADGHVAEGTGSNVFIVRQGRLITPPVTADILEGITRTLIMALAAADGIPVEERAIDRTELYVADEIFLAGTGAQIAPVVDVDDRPVGTGRVGPITARLQEEYFRAVRGEDARYGDWLTPVYA